MRFNKRNGIIIFALVVLVMAGSPYLIGQLVKRQFENMVSTYSDHEPFQMTIIEYHHGWFQSQAKTLLTLRTRALPKTIHESLAGEDITLLFEHDIRQGPFIAGKPKFWQDGRFALALIHSKQVLQSFDLIDSTDAPLLQVESEITLTGAYNAILQGAPVSFKAKEDTSQSPLKKVQAIHGQFHTNWAMDSYTAEIVVPGFDWTWAGNRYVGEDWIFKSARQQNSEHAWLGKDNLFMQRFDCYPVLPDLPLKLTGLTYGLLIDEESDGLHEGINLTLESVQWGKQVVGPMNLQISVNRLNPEMAKIYQQFIKNLRVADNKQVLPDFTPEMIAKLLKTRPEMHIDTFWLKTPYGDIKGNLQFIIGGPNANQIQNKDAIFESMFITAGVLVPKKALESLFIPYYREEFPNTREDTIAQKIHQDIETYIEMGVIVSSDDGYAMDIRYDKTGFLLNGKPWPPTLHEINKSSNETT